VRAFLAVPAEAAWVESARVFTARIKSRLPRASWTRPESFHITLRFLGEITEEAAARFADAVGPAARMLAEGEMRGAGPVAFPSRARVLGVAFDPQDAGALLGAVARAAEAGARSIGCLPEERPLRPHVTLARVRTPWPAAALDEFFDAVREWAMPAWRVRSVVLYASRLDPAGAVHAPLRQWAATGAAAQAHA
jgi:2'-5' RNA ligase